MKRQVLNSLYTIIAAFIITTVFLSGPALAEPVNERQAEKAVAGWLKADTKPFGKVVRSRQIANIETFSDTDTQPVYYVVYLQPSGYVIVPADDTVEPIIAFVSGGTFDPSDDNPLGALVSRDLPARIKNVRSFQQQVKAGYIRQQGTANQHAAVEKARIRAADKWTELNDYALQPDSEPLDGQLFSISDIRVAPLVQSRWDQSTECDENCYNYYTPENYVCGCVATAMSQLMRYHQYPVTGIGVHTFDITVDDEAKTADTLGGDGEGGPYNWTNMVLDPECDNYNDARWEAIGALCYDAGVTIGMSYAESGSGAMTLDTADALKNIFGYGNAVKGSNGGIDDIGTGLVGMVNPNLDAGHPTLFGVGQEGGGTGHCIVCDGYGYNSSTLYHHLNMGWAGSEDAWYNLPEVIDYDVVRSCVYNVFVTGSGEIISGRVTDLYGNPIDGAVVMAQGSGGPYAGITDDKGIYALAKVQSGSTYTVSATKTDYYFENQVVVTGLSADDSAASGNRWAINFISTIDSVAPMPNPAEWEIEPKSTGLHTIAMEAVQASDEAGVEYFFDCVTNGDFNSPAWQDSPLYVRGDFDEDTTYTFRVKARDKSDNQNETEYSDEKSAATAPGPADPCSPFPDPARWEIEPHQIGYLDRIVMQARDANDESGVEYYFETTEDGGPKPTLDSGWQDSPSYMIATGLTYNRTYSFKVCVRDKSAAQNETEWSISLPSPPLVLLGGPPQELHVPFPYTTIQDAIDAAVDGDKVIVHPGTYSGLDNRDIDFKNKAITVQCEEPDSPAKVAATIIDCGGTGSGWTQDSHRAFDFHGTETASSILDGFTIINGYIRVDGLAVAGAGAIGSDGTPSWGGAMSCTNGSSPTIRNCVIRDCVAEGGWGSDGIDGDNSLATPVPDGGDGGLGGAAGGGAIYCDGTSQPTIINCEITNCHALGGASGDGGNGADVSGANAAGAGGAGGSTGPVFGGGIFIVSNNPGVNISGCTITGCTAVARDGGDGGDGGNDNTGVIGVDGSDGGASGNTVGGGIACDAGSSTAISNCTISNSQTVHGDGGAGGLGGAGTPAGADGLDGLDSIANGGGVWCGTGCAITIQGTAGQRTIISHNTADHDGGGFYAASDNVNGATSPVLTDCDITNNSSLMSDGGGIWYGDSGTLAINNCDVSSNSAAGQYAAGGGIYAGDTAAGPTYVDIHGSTTSDNTAEFGGGICMVNINNLTIDNHTASENEAKYGGAIFCSASDANITDSLVSDNAAGQAGSGGGIYAENSSLVVNNCVLTQNDSDSDGGAIYSVGPYLAANPVQHIINCLIADNSAASDGAGIYCDKSQMFLITNCSIVDNSVSSGTGGGVSGRDGFIDITSSILWDNTAPLGSQISVLELYGPWSDIFVSYSDVEGGLNAVYEESSNTNAWWLTGNINQDPEFIQADATDPLSAYYLSHIEAGQQVDSPCIDAGGDPNDDANDLAAVVGMDLTTQTDGVLDTGIVDMGYHYQAFEVSQTYMLVIQVLTDDGFDPNGLLKAELGDPNLADSHNFEIEACNDINSWDVTRGAIVDLSAIADKNFKVRDWSGTDDDNSTDSTNTVTMNSHKVVTVSFTPDGYYYLVTNVTTNNGSVYYWDWDKNQKEPILHDKRTMHLPGEVVDLVASPDNPSHVTHWTGADDDYTIARENTVTMNGHRDVDVEFTAPRILDVGIDSNYPTIQLAIDDAEPGDIVKIASDTYDIYESSQGHDHLHILGKDITITSENPDDPNSTTILGGFIITDVSRYCVIQGLTITGRYRYADPADPTEPPGTDGFSGSPQHGGGMQLHNVGYDWTSSGWWDIVKTNSGSPTVRNCIFRDCYVGGTNGSNGISGEEGVQSGNGGWAGWAHGGAVSCGPDSEPQFEDCLFEGNLARGGHGGKGADGGDTFGPGFGGNWGDNEWYAWDYGPFKPYWKYSGYGGAVYVDANCTAEFTDCTFRDNWVEGGSCGISGLTGTGARVAGWPYQNYKIDRFGGAVYAADDSAPTFKNCTFIDNLADSNEQSMYRDGTTPTVPAYNNISYGGAIALEGHADVTLDNCTFMQNNADIAGAIYSTYSDPNIFRCTITDNNAFHGGGLLCVGGESVIRECRFTGNQATIDGGQGGAIASFGGNTKIIDTQVIDNFAQGSGGGVYISNKDVSGDEVSGYNKILLHNCLIAENQAGFSGGGISANWHGYPEIENCTIANNAVSSSGYGGGLYSSYGNYATINNSIIWGNVAGSGNQIAIRPTERPATVVVSYSDIQGGTIAVQPPTFGGDVWKDDGCTFTAENLHNIGGNPSHNPLFVTGPLGIDYYLSQAAVEGQTVDSPCVDAGDKLASVVKLAGGLTMNNYTTRTDWDTNSDAFDKAKVDMGYHYPFSSVMDKCRICDMAYDGTIDYADLQEFSLRWLWLGIECTEQNNWCDRGDLNFDKSVDFGDYALLANCWLAVDKTPPIPSPMEWEVRPYSTSSSAPYGVSMKAVKAVDSWGWPNLQYQFECTNDPNWDSDWQTDREYAITGLEPDTGYVFKVMARDDMNNITRWSVDVSAVTGEQQFADDNTPPTPDPMTWFEVPYPISDTETGMTASTATDESGVEYGFWNVTLDPGQNNVDWQDEPEFTDTGLTAETAYAYRCAARDKSFNRNVTGWSESRTATTLAAGAEPDNDPPITGVYANIYKAAFETGPSEYYSGGSYYHTMTAVTATDVTEPVQYRFICFQGLDSGWQESPTYDVLVAGLSRSYYLWRVITRDSVAPTPNVGVSSDWHNCTGGVYSYP